MREVNAEVAAAGTLPICNEKSDDRSGNHTPWIDEVYVILPVLTVLLLTCVFYERFKACWQVPSHGRSNPS